MVPYEPTLPLDYSPRLPLYGTYAGVVTDNADPLKLGRVKARVVQVYGPLSGTGGMVPDAQLPWAIPAALPSGQSDQSGGIQFLPNPGDRVFIWFLDGEPEKPVWVWAMQDDKMRQQIAVNTYGKNAGGGGGGGSNGSAPGALGGGNGSLPNGAAGGNAVAGGGTGGVNTGRADTSALAGGQTRTTGTSVFGTNMNGSLDTTDERSMSYYAAHHGSDALGGYDLTDHNLQVVALPADQLKAQFGSIQAARGQYVEITNARTGQTTRAVIGDVGPGSAALNRGVGIDMTPAVHRAIGSKGEDNVNYRFIGKDAGNPSSSPPAGPAGAPPAPAAQAPAPAGAPAANSASGSRQAPTDRTNWSRFGHTFEIIPTQISHTTAHGNAYGAVDGSKEKKDGYLFWNTAKGQKVELLDDAEQLLMFILDDWSSKFRTLHFIGEEYTLKASNFYKLTAKKEIKITSEGTYERTVKEDSTLKVEGNSTTEVKGNEDNTVQGSHSLQVVGSQLLSAKGVQARYDLDYLLRTGGDFKVFATSGDIQLTAGGHMIKIGRSGIQIT